MPEPRDFTVVSESFVRTEIMLRPDMPAAPGVRDDREASPLWDGILGSKHDFG
jgi:hypothetical protein